MLIKPMGEILSQCIHIPNHNAIHFKYLTNLFFNYSSINIFLKKKALTIVIGLFCLQLTIYQHTESCRHTNFIQGFLESENYFKGSPWIKTPIALFSLLELNDLLGKKVEWPASTPVFPVRHYLEEKINRLQYGFK